MAYTLRTRILGSVLMVALSVGIVVALAINHPTDIPLPSGGKYEISCGPEQIGSITDTRTSGQSETTFIFGCVAWVPWQDRSMFVLNLSPHESGRVATASSACDKIGERVLATIDFDSEDGYDHVFAAGNVFECTQSTEQLELETQMNKEDQLTEQVLLKNRYLSSSQILRATDCLAWRINLEASNAGSVASMPNVKIYGYLDASEFQPPTRRWASFCSHLRFST